MCACACACVCLCVCGGGGGGWKTFEKTIGVGKIIWYSKIYILYTFEIIRPRFAVNSSQRMHLQSFVDTNTRFTN